MCLKAASAPSVPQFPQLSPLGSVRARPADRLVLCPGWPFSPPLPRTSPTPESEHLDSQWEGADISFLGGRQPPPWCGGRCRRPPPPELGLSCPLPGPAHSSPGFPCLGLPSLEGHSVGSCPGRPCGLTWFGEVWV